MELTYIILAFLLTKAYGDSTLKLVNLVRCVSLIFVLFLNVYISLGFFSKWNTFYEVVIGIHVECDFIEINTSVFLYVSFSML